MCMGLPEPERAMDRRPASCLGRSSNPKTPRPMVSCPTSLPPFSPGDHNEPTTRNGDALGPEEHHHHRWEVRRGRLKRTVHACPVLVNPLPDVNPRQPIQGPSDALGRSTEVRTRPTDLGNSLPNLFRIGLRIINYGS